MMPTMLQLFAIFVTLGSTIVVAVQRRQPDIDVDTTGKVYEDRGLSTHRVGHPQVNFTVECDGENKTFSKDMVLINNKVLWCPNAKVGTTTVYGKLGALYGMSETPRCDIYNPCELKGKLQSIEYASTYSICHAKTYTFIRNPYDRVMSAYLDKIATGNFNPWEDQPINGSTWQPTGIATFAQFVRYLSKQESIDRDAHWTPVSDRCLTSGENKITYDHYYKLEERFDDRVTEMLDAAGFSSKKLSSLGDIQNHSLTNHTIETRRDFYKGSADLTSSFKDIVDILSKIYKDDLAFGNYSFKEYS